MGLLDWFRPKPSRMAGAIARDLAAAVFALHPAARDRVVVRLSGSAVAEMVVPELDPDRPTESTVDPGEGTARISALAAELRGSAPPTEGDELTVMRDRVIWMPSVVPVQPPVP